MALARTSLGKRLPKKDEFKLNVYALVCKNKKALKENAVLKSQVERLRATVADMLKKLEEGIEEALESLRL